LTRPTGRPRGRPPLNRTLIPQTPEAGAEQTTWTATGTGAPGTIEAITHALALLNAEASRSAPNPAKIRALETSVETQRALLARADSREADRRISELAQALGDIAAYQKTVKNLANEMKGLVSEATRKEEELQLYRSQISSYQPIVERVQRQEASEKARAEAEKIAEKKRLDSEKAAQEISDLEAQVAEIDRRNLMESTRPGSPIDIGREGTDRRADYDGRVEHERKIRQRLRVLRGEITQKNADRDDANVQARKMSEQQRAAHDAKKLNESERQFNS
jgi:hypothetical protein